MPASQLGSILTGSFRLAPLQFEKEEMLALLESRVPEALGAGHAVPLECVGVRSDAMGAGVNVDSSKRYFGLRLGLSGARNGERVLFVLDSAASNSLLTPSASALRMSVISCRLAERP